MEPQNPSGNHLLPHNFAAAAAFPAQIAAGFGGNTNNDTAPLLMSTLQQLSSLSGSAGATGMMPSTTQIALGNQFASGIGNMPWNTQSSWLDQAKMAAMLPMYGMLQSNAREQATMKLGDFDMSMMEQFVARQAIGSQASINPFPAPITPSAAISSPMGYAPAPTSAIEATSGFSVHCPNTPTSSNQAGYPCDTVTSPRTSGSSYSPRPSSSYAKRLSNPPSIRSSSVNSHANTPSEHASMNHSPAFLAQCATPAMLEVEETPRSAKQEAQQERTSLDMTSRFPVPSASSADTNASGIKQQEADFHSLDLSDFGEFFVNSSNTNAQSHSMTTISQTDSGYVTSQPFPAWNERTEERRAEELADADKELDRLVSLVARKDFNKAPAENYLFPSMPSTSFDPGNFAKMDEEDIQLNPVNFTPPDSPTGEDVQATSSGVSSQNITQASNTSFEFMSSPPRPSTAATPAAFSNQDPFKFLLPPRKVTPASDAKSMRSPADSTSSGASSSLAFIPPSTSTRTPIQKKFSGVIGTSRCSLRASNKVPIYKQKAKLVLPSAPSRSTLNMKVVPQKSKPSEDAFSFTDDEEETPALPATPPSLKPAEESPTESQNQAPSRKRNALKGAEKLPEASAMRLTGNIGSRHSVDARGEPQRAVETAADIIRKRRSEQHGFLVSECLATSDSVQPDRPVLSHRAFKGPDDEHGTISIVEANGSDGARAVPKLIIKIGKKDDSSDSGKHKHKKKKKHKKKDRDEEWEPSDHHRKKKKKHKRDRENYERDGRDATHSSDAQQNGDQHRPELDRFSKKHRLMRQWNQSEAAKTQADGSSSDEGHSCDSPTYGEQEPTDEPQHQSDVEDPMNDDYVVGRLNAFSEICENVPKGTFVIHKSDVMKPDCALWKVDNQNLLQKYPLVEGMVFSDDARACYRNSQTYAGWCEQIAPEYFSVQVEVVKQTRSEIIVRPLVSISDMFPAVSSELDGEFAQGCGRNNSGPSEHLSNDEMTGHLRTVVRALLIHSTTMDFLRSIKQDMDWNYLRAFNEVDKANATRLQQLARHVRWSSGYEEALRTHTCLSVQKDVDDVDCQACGKSPSSNLILLYGCEAYDPESLTTTSLASGQESPAAAVVIHASMIASNKYHLQDCLVCHHCAELTSVYHKLAHMKYLTFKMCEEKMEAESILRADLSMGELVDSCMQQKTWLSSVIRQVTETWKQADFLG
ncbi:CBN-EOR-2 protein [Aphelenchoides avenae]|nr:CBN-EOR-2 protein [Aphelenchus avenae]